MALLRQAVCYYFILVMKLADSVQHVIVINNGVCLVRD